MKNLFRLGKEVKIMEYFEGGLDMDDCTGNFGTIEILQNVEELEPYERGVFSACSTISNRAQDLNYFVNREVPYYCYTSVTGYKTIAFNYESVPDKVLSACSLLEKSTSLSVFVTFTLDYA